MVRRRAADTGLKSTTRRSFRTAASSFRASRYARDKDVPPDDYFDEFKTSINLFSDALSHKTDHEAALRAANNEIGRAVASMNEDYEPSSSTSAPTASSTPQSTPLLNLFRDVDE
jgi:hypothetical protein